MKKCKISKIQKPTTLYIWRTSQEHNLEFTPFQAQLECEDGRTMNRLECLMISEKWKKIGESYGVKNVLIFSKDYKSDQDVQDWAKNFPEQVIYVNSKSKEFKWNKKGKRGRPKKSEKTSLTK